MQYNFLFLLKIVTAKNIYPDEINVPYVKYSNRTNPLKKHIAFVRFTVCGGCHFAIWHLAINVNKFRTQFANWCDIRVRSVSCKSECIVENKREICVKKKSVSLLKWEKKRASGHNTPTRHEIPRATDWHLQYYSCSASHNNSVWPAKEGVCNRVGFAAA